MRYEIINPCDKCYIESDDETIACVSVLVLSQGSYGLQDEDGEIVLPVFVFGGANEWVTNHVGNLGDYIDYHREKITKCLRSLSYAEERTSLIDIQGRALRLADIISGQTKEGEKCK